MMTKTPIPGTTMDVWTPSIPVIGQQISLHGLGGDNDDPATMGDDFEKGYEYPFESYHPQLKVGQTDWGINDLRACAMAVKARVGDLPIALTGVSLGGSGVLEMLHRNYREKDWPRLNIICATIVCGFDQYRDYEAYSKVKIKAYHSYDDGRVKIGSILAAREGVLKLGGSFEMDDTLPVGTGHNAWNYGYNPAYPGNAFDWTIKQFTDIPERVERVSSIEIINGQRVRYWIEGGTKYEHDLN